MEKRLDRLLELIETSLALVFSASVLMLFFLTRSIGADPDLFARVAMGRLIVLNKSVPLQDPFAFTPKKEIWIDHEWLSGLIFYSWSQLAGDQALFIFKSLFLLLSVVILCSASRLYDARYNLGRLIWTLLLLADCFYIWAGTVRSHIFTYFFLPLLLWIFVSAEKKAKPLLLYLPAFFMPFWCNAHGGFVVGLGFQGLFAFASLFQNKNLRLHAFLGFLISLATTALNPYGFLEYWNYILHATTMSRQSITEWASVSVFSLNGLLLLACLAIGLAALLIEKRRNSLHVYLLLIAAALYGFKHERLVAILNMLLIVYLPNALLTIWQKVNFKFEELQLKLKRASALAFAVIGLFMTVSILGFIIKFKHFKLDYSAFPVSALTYLSQSKLTGKNVLVDFNAGSFALWRLYPKYLISLDGRYEEVYPESTLKLVTAALDCKSPEHITALNQIAPNFILSSRSSDCFIDQPQKWRVVYADKKYILFTDGSGGGWVAEDFSDVNSIEQVWQPMF